MHFKVFVYHKSSMQMKQTIGDGFRNSTSDNIKKKLKVNDGMRVRIYLNNEKDSYYCL